MGIAMGIAMVLPMRRRNNRSLPLLFCLTLAACGSAPEKPNFRSEQAQKLSARADTAFLQGEYENAKTHYLQALRINESVENAPEIAVTRFNLARVFRELAHRGQAHHHLDILFSEPDLPYPPVTLAAAAALKSQLYLEKNQYFLALAWIEKGEAYCQKKCPVSGSLSLLRAQMAQRDSHLDEALKFADEAVAALNFGQQQMELANAYRLSGEISLAKGGHTRAIHSFQQAYTIDQKLGVPGKIRLDLLRLGVAHERAGDASMALHYYARALTVSEAMGNAQNAEEIRAYMKALQKKPEAEFHEPQ